MCGTEAALLPAPSAMWISQPLLGLLLGLCNHVTSLLHWLPSSWATHPCVPRPTSPSSLPDLSYANGQSLLKEQDVFSPCSQSSFQRHFPIIPACYLCVCVCVCVCVLSHFDDDQLFAAPWTIAHQGPLSMGFSRQECWTGLPYPPLGDLPDLGTEPTSHVSCSGKWALYH